MTTDLNDYFKTKQHFTTKFGKDLFNSKMAQDFKILGNESEPLEQSFEEEAADENQLLDTSKKEQIRAIMELNKDI